MVSFHNYYILPPSLIHLRFRLHQSRGYGPVSGPSAAGRAGQAKVLIILFFTSRPKEATILFLNYSRSKEDFLIDR